MAVLTGVFRIGRDAELRRIPSGEAVINLSLAYNYGNKGSDGKRPTTWVDAALWGKRAESLAQYILKGQQFECTLGELRIESFTKADGTPSTKLAARVIAIDFVSGGNQGSGNSEPRQEAPKPAPKPSSGGFDDMDDDIPF